MQSRHTKSLVPRSRNDNRSGLTQSKHVRFLLFNWNHYAMLTIDFYSLELGAFFKSTSSVSESVQDDPELTGTWIESEAPMLHYAYGDRPKLIERIVAFDMDSTLITTKGTHRFPKDHLDWQFLYTNTVQLLRRVVDKDGYHIVVFTNQAGFVRQPQRLPFFRLKIEAICQAVGFSRCCYFDIIL